VFQTKMSHDISNRKTLNVQKLKLAIEFGASIQSDDANKREFATQPQNAIARVCNPGHLQLSESLRWVLVGDTH
jgi:hypothetical protein